jgi:spore maturation protein CgeB
VKQGLRIAFFGSSLVSAYWNGAATYYRGIIRALHERGHRVTFYEPDAYDRQQHRDIEPPEWANVVVYSGSDERGVWDALKSARGADVVVKASGVGVFDALLEEAVLDLKHPGASIVFWDVDAPATLDAIEGDRSHPMRRWVPRYDHVFTYGGGEPVVRAYTALGARNCVPIYNALDPEVHHRVPAEPRFTADLGFMASRLPDREARVGEFFFKPAQALPGRRFLLGGNGWSDAGLPSNVTYTGHVYTREHNAFNSTPLAILNVNRDSMARYGFSPPTRVFEAAGAGACVITDHWRGVEMFLEPEREVLVARDGDQVAELLRDLGTAGARAIGQSAHRRVLEEHTYRHRVHQVEAALGI